MDWPELEHLPPNAEDYYGLLQEEPGKMHPVEVAKLLAKLIIINELSQVCYEKEDELREEMAELGLVL
tara:strand:- start:24755 stop:24958 length:204 start_codon:yes stop_codon:yes gene_type:complete